MIKNYLIFGLLCSFFGFSQFNSSAPWMKDANSEEVARKKELTINEIYRTINIENNC